MPVEELLSFGRIVGAERLFIQEDSRILLDSAVSKTRKAAEQTPRVITLIRSEGLGLAISCSYRRFTPRYIP